MLTTSLRLTFWSYRSAVIAVDTSGDRVCILHVVPEDGKMERYSTYNPGDPMCNYGATELSRELLGSVTVYDDNENVGDFVEDLKRRIPQLLAQSGVMEAPLRSTSARVSRLVGEVLRPAATEALKEREGRTAHSMSAVTDHFSVYILSIKRARPEPLLTFREPTCCPDRCW